MDKELWKKEEFRLWKEAKDVEEKEKQTSSGRYRQYKWVASGAGEHTL